MWDVVSRLTLHFRSSLSCKRVATSPLTPFSSITNAAPSVRTAIDLIKYLTNYPFRAIEGREHRIPARGSPNSARFSAYPPFATCLLGPDSCSRPVICFTCALQPLSLQLVPHTFCRHGGVLPPRLLHQHRSQCVGR